MSAGAAPEPTGAESLTGRSLEVLVETALADALVVSCGVAGRRFQGVLLDCSKRSLPFGVSALHPVFASSKLNNGGDRLYSVSQRFAYQNSDYESKVPVKQKQQQKTKMTVRLRPRKVLCSKCKGICNENSENVVQTRKRKSANSMVPTKDRKCGDTNSTISTESETDRALAMENSLIPKLSRLHPNEISDALNGNVYHRNEIWIRQADEKESTFSDIERGKYSEKNSDNSEASQDIYKQNRIYSSSEKISDKKFLGDKEFDSECEQNRRHDTCDIGSKKKRIENSFTNQDDSSSNLFSNARTLKISFGEGEGTVVKLPAMIGDFHSIDESSTPFLKNDSKAAKRAMKKAKKQARRQVSPPCPLSPLYDGPYDTFQRKHKHKVKHKKKRKDDKKNKPCNEDLSGSETPDENHSSIEEVQTNNQLPLSAENLKDDSDDNLDDSEICENSSSGWVNCERGYEGVGTGDVVWGKLQGFPWWPGRVIGVNNEGHARVAWFASTTSSLVPYNRLAPFLDNFKVHFNKKKRGPYKEAVRLATLEAGGPLDPLATDPLASAPSNNTLAPLSSPPIDVLS